MDRIGLRVRQEEILRPPQETSQRLKQHHRNQAGFEADEKS